VHSAKSKSTGDRLSRCRSFGRWWKAGEIRPSDIPAFVSDGPAEAAPPAAPIFLKILELPDTKNLMQLGFVPEPVSMYRTTMVGSLNPST
jgi:hypothetical protein